MTTVSYIEHGGRILSTSSIDPMLEFTHVGYIMVSPRHRVIGHVNVQEKVHWEHIKSFALHLETRDGDEAYVIFANHSGSYHHSRNKYLAYDLIVSTEPVNQFPYFDDWMKHIATFAHEVEALYSPFTLEHRKGTNFDMSHTSHRHSSESVKRNKNALQYARGITGAMYKQMIEWAVLDPTATFDDGELQWKHSLDTFKVRMEHMCLICDQPYWLRRFFLKHDVDAWRTAMDETITIAADPFTGKKRLPMIDRSVDPWIPATTDDMDFLGSNVQATLDDYWPSLMVEFGKAVDYYDDHYGERR